MRHNPLNTKQTENQGPQLPSSNEVEDDPPTPHTSYTYSTSQAPLLVFYEGCLLLRSYLMKQTKKRKPPLKEPLIAISFSMERKQE